MTFDSDLRLEGRFDVLRDVGFDSLEDRWGWVVCDSDLYSLA